MKKLVVTLLFLAVFLVQDVGAVIVNINSRVNGPTHQLQVYFDAGVYQVNLIGVADGGAYDGWSPWASTSCGVSTGCKQTTPTTVTGFLNSFMVFSPDLTTVSVEGVVIPLGTNEVLGNSFIDTPRQYRVHDGFVYPNALLALTGSHSSSFTLGVSGLVGFSIYDNPSWLGDNRGGISLDITSSTSPVPEPSTYLLLGGGLLGLVLLRRKA